MKGDLSGPGQVEACQVTLDDAGSCYVASDHAGSRCIMQVTPVDVGSYRVTLSNDWREEPVSGDIGT